jgi:glycosyltransferase involved in cell wall biosynthesis
MYAHELFRAVRDAGEFDPIFVTKAGPPFSDQLPNEGTRFGVIDFDPREYSFYTRREEWDFLLGTARRKGLYIDDWRQFLEAQMPDVVHFQHTLFLGLDMLRVTRRMLPEAPILYTLHEFMPICHRNGKMVRTDDVRGAGGELCDHASPLRCHECFPNISAQSFLLRERFIKAALEHVDLFIAPSEQLRRLFIEWGIPEEKIRYEEYGRLPLPPSDDPPDAGRRRRIGFFGQITPFKGVEVLLEAMRILGEEGTQVELLLHGGNLEFTPEPFQEQIAKLVQDTAGNVRFPGTYEHARLPPLIRAVDWVVVPSTWWENSPLVIQEAMMCGRPVICSDIGGMAEKVRDGVDGLHFRVGDPRSLADTIARAVSTPKLWDTLAGQIVGAHPMDDHLVTISAYYRELMARQHDSLAV